jgi:RNA polymerase sigma factor (TIGR02999 family)
MTGSPEQVTELLLQWGDGDSAALERLTTLVYAELHRLARIYMSRERPGHSLQATALVNEVYLKLVDTRRVHWQNRAHFFAMAARLMRQVLVDQARAHRNQKRGGDWQRVTLDESLEMGKDFDSDILALDEALASLARFDPRKSQVVEMRFFGGLSLGETAEALHISEDTVGRDWDAARAWLLRELKRR